MPEVEMNYAIISSAIHSFYHDVNVVTEEEAEEQDFYDKNKAPYILREIENKLRSASGEPAPLLAFVNVEKDCRLIHGTDLFHEAFPNAAGSRIYCEVIKSVDVLLSTHCILHSLTHERRSGSGEWAFEIGNGRTEGLSRIYSVHEIVVVPRDFWFVGVALREQTGLHLRLTRIDMGGETREVLVELIDCGRPVFGERARFEKTSQGLYREFEAAIMQAREAFQATGSIAGATESFERWAGSRATNNYEKDFGSKILKAAKSGFTGRDRSSSEFDLALQRLYDAPAIAQLYDHGLRDAAERISRRNTIEARRLRNVAGGTAQHPEHRYPKQVEPAKRPAGGDKEQFTELEALQAEIARRPEDMRLRLAYAEALTRQGQSGHADFISRQLADVFSFEEPPTFAWSGFESPSPEIFYEFRRGFVEQVWCPGNRLNQLVPLFEKAPILHLNITPGPTPRSFRQRIFRERLRSLSLASCRIDDDFVAQELCNEGWDKLLWLSLAFNPGITSRGVNLLVEATRKEKFPNLRYLDLEGTESDPREQIAVEGGRLGASWMPEQGQKIEKECGFIEWLHLTDRGNLLELSRFGLVENPCIARGLIKAQEAEHQHQR
ncbi:MAG TPA: hypothetical protein VGL82_09230 [Bryobacteraceae bacterium]